jgi:hypothetical protein
VTKVLSGTTTSGAVNAPGAKIILGYRQPEDDRADERERRGSVAAPVAVAAIWMLFGLVALLFLLSIVLWGLILGAAS